MRCIIYTRVSTDDQTTENQILQLKEYAAKQEWEIVEIITDVCSGGKAAEERQGLNKVFTLAHKKLYDILLFNSLSRLSREGVYATLEYLRKLDNYGIKWHSYTEQYISSIGIFSDAIIAIMATLAKQERIIISERTKAGLARVRAKGIRLGRPKTPIEIITRAKALRESNLSFSEIGKAMGLSKARAYQLVNTEVK